MDDPTPPLAPTVPVRVQEAPTLPTIRDHAERLELAPWKVKAVIARLHGSRELTAPGVDLNTRMSQSDFDAALDVALHGR
jgi:hypothetical protein